MFVFLIHFQNLNVDIEVCLQCCDLSEGPDKDAAADAKRLRNLLESVAFVVDLRSVKQFFL